jgi:hypothetical protein
MYKTIFLITIIAFFFTACEETIELDLEQAPPQLIIEGLVTDKPGYNYVKLSQSTSFDNREGYPSISDAVVQVVDKEGNSFNYVETESGVYRPEEPFVGETGNTYSLMIEWDGKTYTAEDQLSPLSSFDSLTYRVNPEEKANPEDEGRYYDVLIYIQEPQETEDFYLIKFFRNGEVENFDGYEVFAYDDLALSGNIDDLPFPVYYALGDTASIEIYSISRETFRFYQDLYENLNSDGGMFSSIPANARTNIEGGALGYFQVSGLSTASIVIE